MSAKGWVWVLALGCGCASPKDPPPPPPSQVEQPAPLPMKAAPALGGWETMQRRALRLAPGDDSHLRSAVEAWVRVPEDIRYGLRLGGSGKPEPAHVAAMEPVRQQLVTWHASNGGLGKNPCLSVHDTYGDGAAVMHLSAMARNLLATAAKADLDVVHAVITLSSALQRQGDGLVAYMGLGLYSDAVEWAARRGATLDAEFRGALARPAEVMPVVRRNWVCAYLRQKEQLVPEGVPSQSGTDWVERLPHYSVEGQKARAAAAAAGQALPPLPDRALAKDLASELQELQALWLRSDRRLSAHGEDLGWLAENGNLRQDLTPESGLLARLLADDVKPLFERVRQVIKEFERIDKEQKELARVRGQAMEAIRQKTNP